MTQDELEKVTDLLLVSNTPPFLYRGLKRLLAVRALAKTPAAELRATVFNADSQADATAQVTGAGYAALVALLSVADQHTLNELSAREWHKLSWAPWFVTLERAGRHANTVSSTVTVERAAPAAASRAARSSATTLGVTLNTESPRPRVDEHQELVSTASETTIKR